MVGIEIRLIHVDPVLERHVLHPPMFSAAMVGDNIHNHFQAMLMCHVHHLPIKGIVTEARVDVVIIRARISMVRATAGIVLKERSHPYCSGTEIGNIVHVIHNASDVATMPSHRRIPSGLFSRIAGRIV